MQLQVAAILILDGEGNRLAVKYYSPDVLVDYAEQIKFEAMLVRKANRMTARNEVEILMANDFLVLFRSTNDVCLFLVGDSEENELVLLEVTNAIFQCLTTITSGQLGKRQIQENLDYVFLMIDEVVDRGLIFEMDPTIISNRLNMNSGDAAEQTAFNQAISNARENIMRSFLSGAS